MTDSKRVLFVEYHAAAQSLKSAWTRMGSSYGCMMVVLSRRALTIKPHWFAKWLISLLRLDLCHEIPITNIRAITDVGKWASYGKVELRFMAARGEEKILLLFLKKNHEFIDKATKAIEQ